MELVKIFILAQSAMIISGCADLDMILKNTIHFSRLWMQQKDLLGRREYSLKPIAAHSTSKFLKNISETTSDCDAIGGTSPELVIFEEQSFRDLRPLLIKISTCLTNVAWKPVVVIPILVDGSIGNLSQYPPLREFVSSAKIPLDSEVFLIARVSASRASCQWNEPFEGIIHKIGTSSACTTWEVYTIKGKPFIKPVNFKHRKSITSANSENVAVMRGMVVRRRNFDGVVINGVTQNDPSYSLESKLEIVDDELRFSGGVSVAKFLDLQQALNFSGKPVLGTGWLSNDGNTGQWTGIGDQIIRGAADICVSLTENTEFRADPNLRLQLLVPTLRTRLEAFFLRPDASDLRDIFKNVLRYRVWILTGSLGFFSFILIKVFSATIKYSKKPRRESDSELESNSILALIAIACQQGWFIEAKPLPLKIIGFSISLASFILYVSFSASIVSSLAVEIIPIKTLTELRASWLILVGDMSVPKVVDILKITYGKSAEILKMEGIIYDIDKRNPFAKISQGPFAHIGLADEFVSLLRQQNQSDEYFCSHISTVDAEREVQSGMFVAKGSHLKEAFNFGIIKTIETGLNACTSRRYHREALIQCSRPNSKYQKELGVPDILTAYKILILGHILSLITLAFEVLLVACRTKIRKNKLTDRMVCCQVKQLRNPN